MKRKAIPVIMASIMLASAVPANAAWTTTSPVGTVTQTQGYTGYSSMFTDIGGHWAQRFIEQWAANGVFGGMGNGTFSPNTNLTRGQFASVLKQLFDLQMVSKEKYTDYRLPSDVMSSYWGREAIALCLDNGIMNLRNGNFAPDQPITREEVFFALGKAAKLDTLNASGNTSLNRFTDGYMVSSPAREIVGKMVSLGMLAGRGNNMLEPQATITRAEVSTVLTKAVTFVTDTKVKGGTYNNAVIFSVDKNLTLDNIKVNGNMFIKGDRISSISLNNISVSGIVYIYADSVGEISMDDVSRTKFVIICPDVTFKSSKNSDRNTFRFENAVEVDFTGEADEILVKGDFIRKTTFNGDTKDGIDEITIEGRDSDTYKVDLSGTAKTVNIYGDADISGYARVKTLYLDDGNYTSKLAGDTTKVLSGRLKVAGNQYNKGTYSRDEIKGAVTPNTSSTDSSSQHSYVLNSNNNLPKFYYSDRKEVSSVRIDGSTVSYHNYYVNRNDKYLEFTSSYLNTLTAGKYTVKVYYDEGGSDTFTLTIKKAGDTAVNSDYTYVKGSTIPNMYINNSTSALYAVTIDGYTVNPVDYTFIGGYLTINSGRLGSLTNGQHTIRCDFYNGTQATIILNVIDYSVTNTVTPASVYHTKGSVYTTAHTYNSASVPSYITVDGNIINNSFYTVNNYMKTITLASNYVNTLGSGNHTMRVYFANGTYTDVSIVITDEAQKTSYIFDKTMGSTYYKNIIVTGITSAPTLVMVGNQVMPSNMYGYSSANGEVVLFKEYFSSLATGEYPVVISYGSLSRSVSVIVQQSTNNATFVYDKNVASVNHKDITLTGNISNANLQVFVKDRQLNPSEFSYSSGSVTIFKNVFESLDNSTCYVGISSSSGTISAVVNIVNTSR